MRSAVQCSVRIWETNYIVISEMMIVIYFCNLESWFE